MFEGFKVADIKTGSAVIHLRHGGKGPPLLLLHGNPLTHVSWHKIANRLAENFHVVAADLRGYGDSSAPDPGDNHINYSFRAMAQDQVEVMEALGYRRFFAAGIDRGARTLHRMCLDHPVRVQKAVLIDILPNYHIWTHASKEWATRSWHWLFMIQPYDFPERMLAAVPPEWYLEKKLSKPGIGLKPFTKEAFAEYVRCFNEKTIRGSCADYRACATCDFEMDTADKDQKVTCPLLVIWGANSHTGRVHGDVLSVWKNYGTDVIGGPINCGHYVTEEAPDQTYDWFRKFFGNSF
ncbi:MAG: alpha/beta hydrolase [Thermodesulfobacteriota bacterium]